MNRALVLSIPLTLSLALALSLPLAGCGGGLAERRRDPLPQAAATELDTLEHTIAEDELRLETIDPAACADRCPSVESICEASGRICEIARELGDRTVADRCARASRSCDAARAGSDPSCGCAMASDAGVVENGAGGQHFGF